ncbi:glycosyltransferase [Adlercreutzia sp. ZJ154]|uniref:glycosyltransferase family 2 protein n=1 Tax=Adlercreutzia sp. ZJ154 TaxID=2709790 RepID=UPI0013EA31A8|nr:glycosyltransferase [Adlercreutzia sp. ZJ154]
MKRSKKIELIQVFEKENDSRCYRFCVYGGATLGTEIVNAVHISRHGAHIDAQIVLLEQIEEGQYADAAVISATIPAKFKSFKISISGIGSEKISFILIRKIVAKRDSMMVNPGIDDLYKKWIKRNEQPSSFVSTEQLYTLAYKPLFSIVVPLFNTPEEYFKQMINSVLAQKYQNWELILVNASPENASLCNALNNLNDKRIEIIELNENLGISENTNAGIAIAQGDYICFLDHDDTLSPYALAEYAAAINENPNIDLLYCDEDSISTDGISRFSPRFKPELNIDLLNSNNYICHFLTVSREILNKVEPYKKDVDGAQDYDLTLKVVDADGIVKHIPKILYHWRQHEGSTNGGSVKAKPYIERASKIVLQTHYARNNIASLINTTDIPCIFKTNFPASNTDISIIKTRANLNGQQYTQSINQQAKNAKSELIAIICDTVQIKEESVRSLSCWFCRNDIGIASPKMLYADGLIQHAGLCIRENETIGHLNQGFINNMGGGYNGTAETICDFSAVDPACMMFRAEDFLEVGGFSTDYKNSLIAAVDFCFRIRSLNKLVLVDPDSKAINRAPVFWANRIPPWEQPDNSDLQLLWSRWGKEFQQDVLANPNVSLAESYFHLNTK